MPQSGELKHRIKLIKRIDLPSGPFDAMQDETVLFTCWAKIEPTGSAYWGSVNIEEKATHRFWVRTVKEKTDCYSINQEIVLKHKDSYFKPVRVTDANGQGIFTIIEANEIGNIAPEKAGKPVPLVNEVLNV